MKKISRVVTASLVLALLGSVAIAAPKSKGMTCPMCKMTLSKKKDKTHTVAIKTKHGTFYCCAGCGCTAKKKGK